MRFDDLYLWYLGDPAIPRYVGEMKLVSAGKGVSLRYGQEWLTHGFALSEDLPLIDNEFLPLGRLAADAQRAVGAVDDARPDRWGEKVIRFVDKPKRLSLMEYLYYAGGDRFGALGVSTSPDAYRPRESSALPIDNPLVEHATMTLAKQAGITVAETQVIRLAAENAIAVRRFDREQNRRIHCISAGTAIRAAWKKRRVLERTVCQFLF